MSNTAPAKPVPVDTGSQQLDVQVMAEQAKVQREARSAKKEGVEAASAQANNPTPADDDVQSDGDAAQQPGNHALTPAQQRGVEKKLAKLTKRVSDRDEKLKSLIAENEALRKVSGTGAPSPSPQPTPTPAPAPSASNEGRPTRAQFAGDEDQFIEALSDWKVDQRLKAEREKQHVAEQEKVRRTRVETFKDRETKFQADHDDYVEKAYQSPIEYTPVMLDFVMESENGPAVAYHLGHNVEEARKIAALPPVKQGIALDRLERQLAAAPAPSEDDEEEEDDEPVARAAPPARRVTQAPPPPAQVATAAAHRKSPNDPDISTEERIRLWREQGRRRRR